MILNRISSNDNSELAAQKYTDMINSGGNSSEILVLLSNSVSKKNVLNGIFSLSKSNILSDLRIHTYNGFIYNTVMDNWAIIDSQIKSGTSTVSPNLSGLEISQLILKYILKKNEVKGYNSKKSLLHQIFRRYSLIVNNNLSNNEVSERSDILKESFAEDAENIIKKYKSKTRALRCFDYLRQAEIFKYIYENLDLKIKYLIAEDVDECPPLILDFIEKISPKLKDYCIILDKDGSSRCGYLCADTNAGKKLEKIFNEKITYTQPDKEEIIKLTENIKSGAENIIKNLAVHSLSKRLDMLDSAVNTINSLILSGTKPADISVVTPIQDNMLKFTLNEQLKNCRLKFISGSEKLNENPLVKSIINIIKLSLGKPIDEYNLRGILLNSAEIPVKNQKEILTKYVKTKKIQISASANPKYKKLCEVIEKIKNSNTPLSEKAYYAYATLFNRVSRYDLIKFNFFLKQLQDFEKIFPEYLNKQDEIITQAENSIISENPYSTREITENDLIISTPQKIIDNKIKTKYQIWLDLSSYEWIKSDSGPLYNSQVFQKDWSKTEYTIEDCINFSKEKTARTLRKLFNLADKAIGFSSLFDTCGNENTGGIEGYLICEADCTAKPEKSTFHFTPRADQLPVLEYKSGKMAVSAVPGAGKTTVLLELVTKLIKSHEFDCCPENIFVLTYMDSAARNFKDRIKNINTDSFKLPNISTIHGLGLRILKENSNFERLGLNPDFEICDDTMRGRIIKEISGNINKNDVDDFDRAISVFKLSGAAIDNNEKIRYLLNLKKGSGREMKLSRFLKFFINYENTLRNKNLIDYDDILISAVKLLEENEDIRNYYKHICKYIAEDEAQDSSAVQQRLLRLMGGNNIIRCGDINQAITATFTNADISGFAGFINNSAKVDMTSSQRCAVEIQELANSLIKFGNNRVKNTFREICMKPVKDKNPIDENPLNFNIYKDNSVEKIETVKIIKDLLYKNPNCTIGVLLRNNYQVNGWAKYLSNSGLNTITRNECLAQKSIFRVVFSILKFINSPFDNKICADTYKSLAECGIFKPDFDKIIRAYKNDFISEKNDDIKTGDLSRFHWDMNYWLSFPDLSPDALALKIGLHYFSQEPSKSNIHLISTLCAKSYEGDFTKTVSRLEELSHRPSLSGFKFFGEEQETNGAAGKIQVMTMHKSKGDEFDYVFIPELSEKNLTLDVKRLKLKKSTEFTEDVRALNKDYTLKTETELKEFQVSENFRLLYVAITRAKRRLYFSVSCTGKRFGKNVKTEPCVIFNRDVLTKSFKE